MHQNKGKNDEAYTFIKQKQKIILQKIKVYK